MKTKSKKTTGQKIKEILHCDDVSVRNGVFTARRGFYYRNSSAAQYREEVEAALRLAGVAAKIDDCGEKYVAFNGGASVAKSSHWWVTFTLSEGGQA